MMMELALTDGKVSVTTMTETNGDMTEKKVNTKTEMIHLTYEGNFQLECDSKILCCEVIEDDGVVLQLDRTTMHPQGGGQPTDLGDITSEGTVVKISKVTIDHSTGIVSHSGTVSEGFPEVGASVHVSVDSCQRQILSECHTAGHVVDAAMARCDRILPPTKGYHFLDGPYVEYKGTIPLEERAELVKNLQKAFQDLVDDDIETKIETMTKQDADELCNQVQNNFNLDEYGDDSIRIVTVAGWACPCGGTHVRSTKDLKQRQWGVVGIKSKKGVVRVKYAQNVQQI
mmetsp:Transcript_2173/g.3227  ORF Transcript_2173/g.3227 Transcript_2173/m.3227 type:complete len:286 (-) Transcript_2173:107-964(-)